jgi:hypothetical protein
MISGASPVVHRLAICPCDHNESATFNYSFEARLHVASRMPRVTLSRGGSYGRADYRCTVHVDTGQASYLHTRCFYTVIRSALPASPAQAAFCATTLRDAG